MFLALSFRHAFFCLCFSSWLKLTTSDYLVCRNSSPTPPHNSADKGRVNIQLNLNLSVKVGSSNLSWHIAVGAARNLHISPSLSAAAICPDGWAEFDNFCYKHFAEAKNKNGAANTCLAEGAYHVDIQSIGENEFVRGLIPSNTSTVSLGYRRVETGSFKFVWDRTKHVGTLALFTKQPVEDCVEMLWTEPGRWNDVSCSRQLTFICKKGERRAVDFLKCSSWTLNYSNSSAVVNIHVRYHQNIFAASRSFQWWGHK